MQVPANSDGIQKLLAAEQEAQRIVSEARKGDHLGFLRHACSSFSARSSITLACFCADAYAGLVMIPAGKQERLRQAKAEAEKEIAAYRAEREGAYQKRIQEASNHLFLGLG